MTTAQAPSRSLLAPSTVARREKFQIKRFHELAIQLGHNFYLRIPVGESLSVCKLNPRRNSETRYSISLTENFVNSLPLGVRSSVSEESCETLIRWPFRGRTQLVTAVFTFFVTVTRQSGQVLVRESKSLHERTKK